MTSYTKEAEELTGQVLDLCHRLAYPAPTVKSILTAFARQQRAEALEEAAEALRKECPACDGSGVGGVHQATGEAFECEYCGRPMSVLRARAKEIEEDEG
jgi:hypothetical protein